MTKINDNERKVLVILVDDWSSDFPCYRFSFIARETKLEIPQVRRACRSLARKGLTQYVRGLFTEDGEVAGSGYCATEKGAALINPCDVCGNVAAYDYDGKKE
jgi:hypothetical protein